MGEWSNLTQREKSNIIRFAIKNGVSDINTIRDTFNVYAKDSLANVDYNMAAAKASGFGSNGNGHYPDTFKKPNHPTFSDESIYHSEATPGGRWRGNTYEPSGFVLNQQGGWNPFLKGFYNQEQGTGAVPVFNGGVMLPEVTTTPQYKEGGKIYIKLSKRGTFTAAAKKHGKSVQEFARQVLANKENYSTAMARKAVFAHNSKSWKHSDGGLLASIPIHRNSLDRKYDFIVDTWDSEYTVPKGYNKKQDLFFPYDSPEGGTQTIGPGLKLRKGGKGDDYSFSKKEAAKGVTRAQINEKLANHADLQYQRVLEFLNQKGNRLPYDTISPNIMSGLMDLRYQVGSLGGWNDLREAVLNGNLKDIKKESKVTYETEDGKRKEDKRRNEHRANAFWHYSTGGPLYPFSFQKNPYWKTPIVRY